MILFVLYAEGKIDFGKRKITFVYNVLIINFKVEFIKQQGDTRAITSFGDNKNEIAAYEDTRTMGSYSDLWRIFQFQMHERYPKFMSLTIHLEDNEQVFFDEEDGMNEIVNSTAEFTHLTAFYT